MSVACADAPNSTAAAKAAMRMPEGRRLNMMGSGLREQVCPVAISTAACCRPMRFRLQACYNGTAGRGLRTVLQLSWNVHTGVTDTLHAGADPPARGHTSTAAEVEMKTRVLAVAV